MSCYNIYILKELFYCLGPCSVGVLLTRGGGKGGRGRPSAALGAAALGGRGWGCSGSGRARWGIFVILLSFTVIVRRGKDWSCAFCGKK